MSRRVLIGAALAGALAIPAAAPAVVPPKSCGSMTVKARYYQIKADQISCKTARDHARRYLQTGRKPSGYRCRKPSTARNRVNFICNNGRKNFFGIRR
ncbi:MAG TPA: hypothetical protein VGW75_16280 [Solirubrobacteraceae bacterium]|jgi:opacity protein-like surface antigen|nr:hypothetical protein [Solirubrobacteraceae bacterium]